MRWSRSAARTPSAWPPACYAEHDCAGRGRPQDDRQRPLRHRLHVRVRHGALDRDRGHRPAALDRRVPRPRHGLRGDGPPRRLDRAPVRHGRRRRRRADPRAAGHRRALLRADRPPPPARQGLLDRGGQRGLGAALRGRRCAAGGRARGGRLRPHPPGRHRRDAGRRDRAAHGLRDARHPARSRPARRVAHRARPRAGDPLRPASGRPRVRGVVRHDGVPARRRDRGRADRRCRGRAEDRAARALRPG